MSPLLRQRLLTSLPSRSTFLAPRLIPYRSQSSSSGSSDESGKALSSGQGAKGKTGGGPALESTARGAPEEPPKVVNARVPGVEPEKGLDEQQRKEVEEHNKAFEKKHDLSQAAPGCDSKVNEKFWKSGR
ncbi:hypothetical protein CP532_4023 [Ophiocordyceps camponoti-leonardi (nom. inval.)]|nr:hypothetical protein CP532_4023 [Ophiocordyceps camponoti-leonardi (nom. inval.)]